MSVSRPSRCVLLVLAAIAAAAGQQIPFQLRVTQGKNTVAIQNGGQFTFNGSIGQTQTARMTATYSGAGQVTISQPPVVLGSTAFEVEVAGSLPVTLSTDGSLSVNVRFTPTTVAQSNAQLSLPFTETVSGNSPTQNLITLSFVGTASSFAISYALQADQNVVPLQAGGTIALPTTLVDTTAQAALNLTNTGSGTGIVTGISITGSAFRLSGLPLFPVAVPTLQNLQVLLRFQPTRVGSETGEIQITFDVDPPVIFHLEGSGSSPAFVYQILGTDFPPTLVTGGTVPVPDTNVGQTSSIVLRVLNSGSATGTITSISLAGQAFQLSNLPVLPRTLAPDASITFTVTFAPAQPGALSGSVLINSDVLNLKGTGLAPRLEFSYLAGGSPVTLSSDNNSVVFSPVMISQSSQLKFTVRNTGTLAAVISNIGVGQTTGLFMVSGLPPLPVSLDPGSDLQLTIRFTPTVLGFSNGTLQIDTANIGLVGSGTQPPPLPDYVIAGPIGNAAPRSQPGIGLTLADAYPVAIAGTLTLAVSGNLPADPAIQFATGGRTVAFVIPANSTRAVFGSQGTEVGLQTGTVASTVTLTPSFATQAGNVDLTPSSPSVLQFAVAPAAPTLTALQLTNQTGSGVSIVVTGFSTNRTLTAWNIQFATVPGVKMAVSQFAIDVRQIATVWFQSNASETFGGQFAITVPFVFDGTASAGQSLAGSIASVTVSMNNELGSSNSIQVKLQ